MPAAPFAVFLNMAYFGTRAADPYKRRSLWENQWLVRSARIGGIGVHLAELETRTHAPPSSPCQSASAAPGSYSAAHVSKSVRKTMGNIITRTSSLP